MLSKALKKYNIKMLDNANRPTLCTQHNVGRFKTARFLIWMINQSNQKVRAERLLPVFQESLTHHHPSLRLWESPQA